MAKDRYGKHIKRTGRFQPIEEGEFTSAGHTAIEQGRNPGKRIMAKALKDGDDPRKAKYAARWLRKSCPIDEYLPEICCYPMMQLLCGEDCSPKYRLYRAEDGKLYIMSKMLPNFIPAFTLFEQIKKECADKGDIDIRSAIKQRMQTVYDLPNIPNIIAASLLIGRTDVHGGNWGVIQDKDGADKAATIDFGKGLRPCSLYEMFAMFDKLDALFFSEQCVETLLRTVEIFKTKRAFFQQSLEAGYAAVEMVAHDELEAWRSTLISGLSISTSTKCKTPEEAMAVLDQNADFMVRYAQRVSAWLAIKEADIDKFAVALYHIDDLKELSTAIYKGVIERNIYQTLQQRLNDPSITTGVKENLLQMQEIYYTTVIHRYRTEGMLTDREFSLDDAKIFHLTLVMQDDTERYKWKEQLKLRIRTSPDIGARNTVFERELAAIAELRQKAKLSFTLETYQTIDQNLRAREKYIQLTKDMMAVIDIIITTGSYLELAEYVNKYENSDVSIPYAIMYDRPVYSVINQIEHLARAISLCCLHPSRPGVSQKEISESVQTLYKTLLIPLDQVNIIIEKAITKLKEYGVYENITTNILEIQEEAMRLYQERNGILEKTKAHNLSPFIGYIINHGAMPDTVLHGHPQHEALSSLNKVVQVLEQYLEIRQRDVGAELLQKIEGLYTRTKAPTEDIDFLMDTILTDKRLLRDPIISEIKQIQKNGQRQQSWAQRTSNPFDPLASKTGGCVIS